VKIVSLLPSATEIVYALGLGDDLEGVTYECDYPAEAKGKPVISTTTIGSDEPRTALEIDRAVREKMAAQQPIYALDEERIRSISPDLILAQDLCRVCAVPSGQVEDALEKIGCTSQVISLDPFSIEEILDGIEEVGRATGMQARAWEVATELRERVALVESVTMDLRPVRTFALEWLDPPFVGGHWIPGMVELAGGINLLNGPRQPSRTVTWSEIRDADPDVIVFMPCGFGLDEAVAQAESIKAKKAVRVYATDASAYFSRPGPRIVDGLEILAWALHPEAFPEPPEGRAERLR
jgi:iron complex transport system substrate-binding protein